MGGDFYIRSDLIGKSRNKLGEIIDIDIFIKREPGYYNVVDEDEEPKLPNFQTKKLYEHGNWLITYSDRIEFYNLLIKQTYRDLGEIIELYRVEQYEPR